MRYRWHIIADLISQYNCKNIAEIGVESGPTALYIINNCLFDNYYLVDIQEWKIVTEMLNDKCHYIIDTSENSSLLIPDKSLDLVFIDANHDYDFIKQDIELWLPKVKDGGIISGHDFCDKHEGVKQAVREKFIDFHLDVDMERESVDAVWWLENKEENIK